MSKTITIDSCSVCPFAMLQPNYLRPSTPYCAKNNTIRDGGTAIPSWCPLPDTQEQGWRGIDGLAHEIWATAQLLPGEGITDGVDRIINLLKANLPSPPQEDKP